MPFKFSTKIDIENALTEKGMKGEMPILKIKDEQSGKNFTLSFPYAQQDIKFIEAEIRERRYKMMKSKEAKAPKFALKKTISLKGASKRANIEILKKQQRGRGRLNFKFSHARAIAVKIYDKLRQRDVMIARVVAVKFTRSEAAATSVRTSARKPKKNEPNASARKPKKMSLTQTPKEDPDA